MAPTGAAATAVPPHWNVNLRVDDAAATLERAAVLGGRVMVPVLDTPGFRSAVLADPQGAVFSIGQLTGVPQAPEPPSTRTVDPPKPPSVRADPLRASRDVAFCASATNGYERSDAATRPANRAQ